jgi:hypothetical protein
MQSNINPKPQNKKKNELQNKQLQERYRRWSTSFWVILLLLLLVNWLGGRFLFCGDEATTIDYSTFRIQVMADKLTQVTVNGEEISGQVN